MTTDALTAWTYGHAYGLGVESIRLVQQATAASMTASLSPQTRSTTSTDAVYQSDIRLCTMGMMDDAAEAQLACCTNVNSTAPAVCHIYQYTPGRNNQTLS